jgi:hypothetical protein
MKLGFRLFADDVTTFFITTFVLLILDSYTPLFLLNYVVNRWLLILGGALAVTWAARKLDPDGKPLVRYLFGAVAHLFRSHVGDGFRRFDHRLARRQGKRTRVGTSAKVVWTRGDLPLPVTVYGDGFRFESGTHLDVLLRRGRTVLKKAGRFHRSGRYRVPGLRPGRYEVQQRMLVRRDG